MTMDDAFAVGRVIGMLEATIFLLKVIAVGLGILVLWAMWKWRSSKFTRS